MTVKLTLDLAVLNARADQALQTSAIKLGGAIRQGFGNPVYSWPGVTKRRSGQLAGTTRDVTDLGTLRDSQTAPTRVAQGHYQIAWTAPYAAAVFLGAVFKRRRGSLPARNVPLNVARDFEFAAAFTAAWKGG